MEKSHKQVSPSPDFKEDANSENDQEINDDILPRVPEEADGEDEEHEYEQNSGDYSETISM